MSESISKPFLTALKPLFWLASRGEITLKVSLTSWYKGILKNVTLNTLWSTFQLWQGKANQEPVSFCSEQRVVWGQVPVSTWIYSFWIWSCRKHCSYKWFVQDHQIGSADHNAAIWAHYSDPGRQKSSHYCAFVPLRIFIQCVMLLAFHKNSVLKFSASLYHAEGIFKGPSLHLVSLAPYTTLAMDQMHIKMTAKRAGLLQSTAQNSELYAVQKRMKWMNEKRNLQNSTRRPFHKYHPLLFSEKQPEPEGINCMSV